MTLKFEIPIEPKAQKRHRHHKFGVYDPSSSDKKEIRKAILKSVPKEPFESAIVLHIHFKCKRPKSHYGTGKNKEIIKQKALHLMKTTKPDLDNYIKLYMDVFSGLFWKDDNQVIQISSSKCYADNYPRAEVMITEV